MYSIKKKKAFNNIAFAKYAASKKSLEFRKKKNRLKIAVYNNSVQNSRKI